MTHIISRFSLDYRPEGGDTISICRADSLLLAAPDWSWELSTQSIDLIASAWAEDRPNGNARRLLSLSVLQSAASIAQLERKQCRMEYDLNLSRLGSAVLKEAYQEGTALVCTEWRALIMSARTRVCNSEEAYACITKDNIQHNCWGILELELQLTKPQDYNG